MSDLILVISEPPDPDPPPLLPILARSDTPSGPYLAPSLPSVLAVPTPPMMPPTVLTAPDPSFSSLTGLGSLASPLRTAVSHSSLMTPAARHLRVLIIRRSAGVNM